MPIYCKKSITETCKTTNEVIEKVYKRTLYLRKKSSISYRPYTLPKDNNQLAAFRVDIISYYPDAKIGDYAYVSAYMDGLYETDLILKVKESKEARVYFNDKEATEFFETKKGIRETFVRFKEGRNFLLIKIPYTADGFCAEIILNVPGHRSIPVCYGYCTWQYILKEGFRYQMLPQISTLFTEGKAEPTPLENAIKWVYPKMPPQPQKFNFDFHERCRKGKTAYAHTYANGNLKINHQNPMKVFEGENEIYSAENGVFKKFYDKLTPILIKSTKNNGQWAFCAEADKDFAIPTVDGADCPDLSWMWVGPFGREEDNINHPYPPEKNLSFEAPYASICAGQVYWNFYRENTYLRQFLHSDFFGQWFYAIMVSQHGLLMASKVLGDDEYINYFCESMKLISSHRRYALYDKKKMGSPSYLHHATTLDRLDPIGTIGMNVAEYYMMTGDVKAEQTLEKLSSAMLNDVPRFPDGTFYRIDTMWTDDIYMCLPFLARLGIIFSDDRYFNEILTQVKGFEKRLYMRDKNIFSHIFFPKENQGNKIPWGRGNGWVLLALSEALLLMPEKYKGRDEVLDLFKRFSHGILKFRDEKYGFWHQVLDNPDSYMESSGSAMFIIALSRGVRMGWLDGILKNEVIDAWHHLAEECIDSEGNVHGVCMGSSCSMDEEYYLNLGTAINDDHGVGIILTAASEISKLEENF